MPKFEIKRLEQISVWQEVVVLVDSENESALLNGDYEILDYLNLETDWSTEQHLSFDNQRMEILRTIEENENA
jgi:hypothetical protein